MIKKLFMTLLFLQTMIIYSKENQDKTEYFYINFQAAYYPPHALGTGESKFSPSFISPQFQSVAPNKQISPNSWGSIKLVSYLGYYHFFELLNNPDSPLLKNNGIDIDCHIGISPVVALLKGKISFTPIAFINLYTGVEFGIGWEGFGFKGIGVHIGNGQYSRNPEFYSETIIGGRLQFDLNAVLDGDWTHIIAVAGNNILYINNPHADDNQLWKYKADEGKNVNGFKITPYALLAYKMPLPLNTIGLLYEGQTYIGHARYISTIQNKGWGSNFFYHNISLISKVEIKENLTLDMQFKFSTAPMYTANTLGMADVSKRISANNSYIYYDSIGFSLTYKI
ncbi:hypothetical protein baBA2_000402 [Borrelia anserina]|uniref:Outer membrane protein n=2 Tax=Borrelia anserina TaxID=143 RepID=W5SNC0_BORAN|nr:hypothetical protein [Borrelia anserina]AHH08392.1 Hypothetical protein BAN_0073600 [Borrelia anserina BA2]APR64877.1 hypothetical protein N187_01995 [Borrelia anserina Es]UPA06799.1 hypothetical protein baBA2_000402 [Borrelia anserina]